MGKTHRYTPEGEEFGAQDHRIRRHDINAANHAVARHLISSMAPVVPARSERPVLVVNVDWIPKKLPDDSTWVEFLRDQRLDLLQGLGERAIENSL